MWLLSRSQRILLLSYVMLCFGRVSGIQITQSFDKASLLQQQIERILHEVEIQRDQVVTEVMSLYAPSTMSRLINFPRFLLKHSLYVICSGLVGAGILCLIGSDDLAKIRDAFLERESFWGLFKEQQARAVLKDPQFLGKTVLSFVLPYLTLIILFEYILKSDSNEVQRETLQKLARMLEHYELKLKELKIALP